MTHASLAYYEVREDKRLQQMDMFKANPDLQTAINSWNIIEQFGAKQILEKTFPKIKNHWVIHIPKLEERLTLENIDKELPAYPDNIFQDLENDRPFEMLGEDPDYDTYRYTKVRILSAQNLPTSPTAVLEKKEESKFDL